MTEIERLRAALDAAVARAEAAEANLYTAGQINATDAIVAWLLQRAEFSKAAAERAFQGSSLDWKMTAASIALSDAADAIERAEHLPGDAAIAAYLDALAAQEQEQTDED
jgi:hypothetical protein